MGVRLRWLVVILAATVMGVLAVAATAATEADASFRPPATIVDGIAFGRLPAGLGTSSDFDYTFAGMHFAARVWESRSDHGWLSGGQVFWLQQPGLAVSVSLDRTRWPVPDVVRTGWSAYPAPP